RPKCPDARFTDTPWHQDGQYFREQAHIHIMTVWFPLHAVDAQSSCLAVSSDLHKKNPGCMGEQPLKRATSLFENFLYEDNGFIGIRRDEAKGLTTIPIAMERGDALCFPQLTPHRAMPNETNLMRWSMDLRFLSADRALPAAMQQGMVVRSKDPARLTSYGDWKKKWE
ncbi:MAG: phytanoyl-CoA dioxygenase family protein, partial [Spirochaetia bacterium]|nr:phytanoyl-CoA dioxygenase family protein [Spirochaetia bacterium]